MKVFLFLTELVGCIRIALSPILISFLISAIIYYHYPTDASLVIAGILILAGGVIGVVWARKAFKGNGTIWFLSRIVNTPELDQKHEAESQAEEGK